jgi:hypothetical protein
MTAFNTVVLFDVENLLGAPAWWKKAAAKLSFGDILTQLRRDESGTIGGFAVSRAYANWGHEFMATLRREMTENGVEPRRLCRRRLLESAQVNRRRLHRAAKARRGAHRDEEPPSAVSKAESALLAPSDQILDETREKVLVEVERMARADGERLEREGIPLTTVGHRFASSIPALGAVRSGYPGLPEFLQWALVGTPYCVVSKNEGPEGARPHLGRRSRTPRGFRQLSDLERRPPRHFADPAKLYRLLASQGEPYLRLGDPQSIALSLSGLGRKFGRVDRRSRWACAEVVGDGPPPRRDRLDR